MKCPYCGNDIPDTEFICPECGNMVGTGRAPGRKKFWNKKRQKSGTRDPLMDLADDSDLLGDSSTYQMNGGADLMDMGMDDGFSYNPGYRSPAPKRRIPALAIIIPAVLILLGGVGAVLFSLKNRPPAGDESAQAVLSEDSASIDAQGQDASEDAQEQDASKDAQGQDASGNEQGQDQVQETDQGTEQSPEDDASDRDDSEEAPPADSPKGAGAAAEIDSSIYYFRPMLEGEELELYDALYSISRADATDTEKKVYVTPNPKTEEFAEMLAKVRSFMTTDHPELFYITTFSYIYYDTPENGKFEVTISPGDFKPSDHLEETEELERAADALLSDIDTSQSSPRIALQIHDKILELVQYDYVTFENNEGSDQGNSGLAYTSYGALVENDRGESNLAVCSGYAAAYEYLLQKEGITSIVISGNAWSEGEEGGSHAWNMVELDGDWYETDCTWDDNIYDGFGDVEGDILVAAVNDDWYRNTIDHYLFNVTTDRIENFDPGDDFTFYCDYGYATFLNRCGRSRYTWDDVEYTGNYATLYAPIAEGTKYSYDNIR